MSCAAICIFYQEGFRGPGRRKARRTSGKWGLVLVMARLLTTAETVYRLLAAAMKC